MTESFHDTILYLIQRYTPHIPLFIKIIFLLFALFFLGFIIYFFKKASWFYRIFWRDFIEFTTSSSFGISKSKEALRKISERLKNLNEDEAKLAIIEADDLLNESLNTIGYKKEESLGEKLDEITSDTIPNLEEIIEAHKVRSNIIHDPAYRLSAEEAKNIFSIYEKAILNLETL